MIQNPYPGPEHHQKLKLVTSRGSPLSNIYHVWTTSVTAIVSYPSHRTTDGQTDRRTEGPSKKLGYQTQQTSPVFARWRYSKVLCVSEITYNVSSGKLNPTIYYAIPHKDCFVAGTIRTLFVGAKSQWTLSVDPPTATLCGFLWYQQILSHALR